MTVRQAILSVIRGVFLGGCLCVALSAYDGILAVDSTPRTVQVKLFDTRPRQTHQNAVITGQFSVIAHQLHPQARLLLWAEANRVTLKNLSDQPLGQFSSLQLQSTGAQGVCIQPSGWKHRRCYPGRITVSVKPGEGLNFQNQVSAPVYVAIVLSSELPAQWPVEAKKAQAILTANRLRTKKSAVLSDSTQDEAYLGIRQGYEEGLGVVQAVWSQYLAYNQQAIEVYYHSTCGGHTSHDGYFKGSLSPAHPYSVGVACPYCKSSPFSVQHEVEIPVGQLKKEIPHRMWVTSSDAGKRPFSLKIKISRDGQWETLSAYQYWLQIGQRVGWDKLPGTRFNVESTANTIIFKSHGAGHGVGLCQWGAAGMARQGSHYQKILGYYFPKARLIGIKDH